MYKFTTSIESPKSHQPHIVVCEGEWVDSDGDEIRPSYRLFSPEAVWVKRGKALRRLQDLPYWLWEALSYAGEDSYRDMLYDADVERGERFEEGYWQ